MRPIIVIYIVTGLTLFFALASAIAHTYTAHMVQGVVASAHGETLAKAQDVLNQCEQNIAVSLILAVMQIVIIFYAGKLNKKAIAA